MALLTRRELEVVAMLAEGETNARIAQRLVVSEDTVKTHVKHILRKLGVHNRSQAVSRYFRAQAPRLAAGQDAPFREERSPVRPMRAEATRSLGWPGDRAEPLPNKDALQSKRRPRCRKAALRARGESAPTRTGRRPAQEPLLSVVVPTKNERGNVAALVERLEAVLPTVAMEIIFVDASTDGTAEAVEEMAQREQRATSCSCASRPNAADRRARRGGGPGAARRARSLGLRDGRRPPAPARADHRAAGAGRGARPRSRRREPLLRARRRGRLRLGARDGLALEHDGRAPAVPAPAARRDRPDERLLPGAPRRVALDQLRPRGLQDPARDPGPQPGAAGRRGVVRLRRAARRQEQGDDPRGGALPLAARAAALRALRRRRRVRPRGQHAGAGAPDRRRRAVLRRLGRHRDPGIDAVELLLHRALGLRGSRAQARRSDPAWRCSSS